MSDTTDTLPEAPNVPDSERKGGCSAVAGSAHDRRTRAGRRKEILDHIRFHGGFSIFWVTEHRLRAVVAEEMEKAGEIVTDNKTHGYPWLGAKVLKQNVKILPTREGAGATKTKDDE